MPNGRTLPSTSSSRARDAVRFELAHLPGVVAVEPRRTVAVRIRSGHRERYLAITGVPPNPRLKRIVDRNGREVGLPPSGVVLSQMLGEVLAVTPGDTVTLDVLEGHRPTRRVEVGGLVDDILGLSAYMDSATLHAMMREDDVATGALLLVDSAQEARLSRRLKGIPAVAGAGFKRAVLRSFRDVMAANMNLTIFINVLFASVIAFGVVLQRRAHFTVGTESRAGKSARTGFHAGRDLADLARRAGDSDSCGPADRRPLRLQSYCR